MTGPAGYCEIWLIGLQVLGIGVLALLLAAVWVPVLLLGAPCVALCSWAYRQ